MEQEKEKKRGRPRKYDRVVRTTITLPEDLWRKLRIEGIRKRKTLGEVIVDKLKELEILKSRSTIIKETESLD